MSFFIFSSTWAKAATCNELQSSLSIVSAPKQIVDQNSLAMHAKTSREAQGFYLASIGHLQFLCAQLEPSEQSACKQISLSILNEAVSCLSDQLNLNQVRSMGWAYLRHDHLGDRIQKALSLKANSKDDQKVMFEVWQRWHVLILSEAIQTFMGSTKSFSLKNLQIIEKGFETLQQAVENAFGKDQLEKFSHLWNAGGVIARKGEVSFKGQLGFARSDLPFQVNIVTDTLPDATELGIRIAHESSHLNDYLQGYLMTGQMGKWTEQPGRTLFRLCHIDGPAILPEAKTEFVADHRLEACLTEHPSWMSFHKAKKSSLYAAFSITEFYTKMVDAWVRENIGQTPKDRYRELSPETEMLWSEMEKKLILGNLN